MVKVAIMPAKNIGNFSGNWKWAKMRIAGEILQERVIWKDINHHLAVFFHMFVDLEPHVRKKIAHGEHRQISPVLASISDLAPVLQPERPHPIFTTIAGALQHGSDEKVAVSSWRFDWLRYKLGTTNHWNSLWMQIEIRKQRSTCNRVNSPRKQGMFFQLERLCMTLWIHPFLLAVPGHTIGQLIPSSSWQTDKPLRKPTVSLCISSLTFGSVWICLKSFWEKHESNSNSIDIFCADRPVLFPWWSRYLHHIFLN